MKNQSAEISAQIDRLEAYQAIQQLVARYALAVDSKDLDAIVDLFVSDVNAGGRWGTGRAAIRNFYEATLSGFYRSIHLIAGHVIDFQDGDHARGVVHCRAEHEVGGHWNVMVMNYADEYEREAEIWRFRRRRLQPLYFVDITDRPCGPDFMSGEGVHQTGGSSSGTRQARLPGEWSSFSRYWQRFPESHVQQLTSGPVHADSQERHA